MKRLPIFFDTEFSSLEVDAKMLSAGFVSANGQELYVEVKDSIDPAKCSPFVLETVLPLLQGGPHLFTLSEIARKLKGWIEAMSSEVVLVSDLPQLIGRSFTIYSRLTDGPRTCPSVVSR